MAAVPVPPVARRDTDVTLTFACLPEEVRAQILNKLSQDHVPILRQVSRQVREDVDNHYELSIDLSDVDEDREEVDRWLLTTYKIQDLRILAYRQGPKTYVPFRFPKFLKSLEAHDLMMDPNKFHRCETMFYPATEAVDVDCKYRVHQLKTLRLADGFLPNRVNRPLPTMANAQIWLNRLILANTLKFLKIDLYILNCRILVGGANVNNQQVCSVWTINVLNLIANNARTLTNVNIRLFEYCPNGDEQQDLLLQHGTSDQTVDRAKLATVKGIQNVFLTLKLKNSLMRFFYDLLMQQSGIQVLRLHDDGTPLMFPSGLHRPLILNNSGHLREVDISDFGNSGMNEDDGRYLPFDMSAFHQCFGFKKINLKRNLVKRPRIVPLTAPELINLYQLPRNLEDIELMDFVIGIDDLFHYFTIGRSIRNIERVSIRVWAPTVPGLGVEFEVLNALLALPQIKCLEIDKFNFPAHTNRAEWEELEDRVESYNLPFLLEVTGNQNIQGIIHPLEEKFLLYMFRNSVTSPWIQSVS